MKIRILFMVLLLAVLGAYAQEVSITVVNNSSSFASAVAEHPYVVAYFHKPLTGDAYNAMVTFVSTEPLYQDAGLHFIFASVGSYDLKMLAQRYGVDQFPAFLLFDHGRLVKDKQGAPEVLIGKAQQSEIMQFIDHYFKQKLIRRANQRPRRVVEVVRSRPTSYFGVGFGGPYYGGYWGGYPYWGGPYWGGYGGVGIGFSVGI